MVGPVKVLTVRQPWATLIALGLKRVEWRPWARTHYGSTAKDPALFELAIHASARTPTLAEIADDMAYLGAYREVGDEDGTIVDVGLAQQVILRSRFECYGSVVAVVQHRCTIKHAVLHVGNCGWEFSHIRPAWSERCSREINGIWEIPDRKVYIGSTWLRIKDHKPVFVGRVSYPWAAWCCWERETDGVHGAWRSQEEAQAKADEIFGGVRLYPSEIDVNALQNPLYVSYLGQNE